MSREPENLRQTEMEGVEAGPASLGRIRPVCDETWNEGGTVEPVEGDCRDAGNERSLWATAAGTGRGAVACASLFNHHHLPYFVDIADVYPGSTQPVVEHCH